MPCDQTCKRDLIQVYIKCFGFKDTGYIYSGVVKVGHTGYMPYQRKSCAPPRCFSENSKIATITLLSKELATF